MCAIFGITTLNSKVKKDKFKKSSDLMNHRGPDEEGYLYEEHYSLAHKRLVVIDKEHGKQPMSFDDYTIIYNGELYNTEDVRKILIKEGISFVSYSDTEVILKAYIKYKEKCLELLNGIFAFAIYYKDEVFTARDRLGVKPLYYTTYNEELLVSSEIKGILNYYNFNTVTLDGLRELLALGPSHTQGKTVYKHVCELEAGHYIYKKGYSIQKHQYWDVKPAENPFSIEDTKYIVKNLLMDSITRQTVSDVPLATFLSGGIDSSTITSKISILKEDLKSFSVDYEKSEKFFKEGNFLVSNDQDYIKYVTNMTGHSHTNLKISTKELSNTLSRAVELRDYPGMADIDSSLYWFATNVKKTHTVCLSGECADEIFGGYPWYQQDTKLNIYPWIRDVKSREDLLNEKLKSKLDLSSYLQKSFDDLIEQTPLHFKDSKERIEERRMFYINIKSFMTTLLDRKDRMTMGGSLEVRVPFADHRLVEFLYNVSMETKNLNNMEKGLLREVAKDLLPKEILDRKKSPYPKTFDEVYTSDVIKLLSEAIADKKSILHEIFSIEKLYELIESKGESYKKPWFGQLMKGPQLIAYLYQIHYWGKAYNIKIEY